MGNVDHQALMGETATMEWLSGNKAAWQHGRVRVESSVLRGGLALVALALLAASCTGASPEARPSLSPTRLLPSPTVGDAGVTVVAAGDIACHSTFQRPHVCRQKATSDLILSLDPTAVLMLGDAQYGHASIQEFRQFYAPSWGRFLRTTHPTPGNHDYATKGAAGYFQYFGAAAGPPGKGYYSFDLGDWHVVSLNGNCSLVPCRTGSDQERWLRNDLARHPALCTMAIWHEPLFASSASLGEASDARVRPLWAALYDAGAEVVLNGHLHVYERFAPQNPEGRRDEAKGITEFVVGTGGKSLYPFGRVADNSLVRNNQAFGVLELQLLPKRFTWRFLPEGGQAPTDSGDEACH
jgi:hypothetical protein